eukprot:gene1719-488_t
MSRTEYCTKCLNLFIEMLFHLLRWLKYKTSSDFVNRISSIFASVDPLLILTSMISYFFEASFNKVSRIKSRKKIKRRISLKPHHDLEQTKATIISVSVDSNSLLCFHNLSLTSKEKDPQITDETIGVETRSGDTITGNFTKLRHSVIKKKDTNKLKEKGLRMTIEVSKASSISLQKIHEYMNFDLLFQHIAEQKVYADKNDFSKLERVITLESEIHKIQEKVNVLEFQKVFGESSTTAKTLFFDALKGHSFYEELSIIGLNVLPMTVFLSNKNLKTLSLTGRFNSDFWTELMKLSKKKSLLILKIDIINNQLNELMDFIGSCDSVKEIQIANFELNLKLSKFEKISISDYLFNDGEFAKFMNDSLTTETKVLNLESCHLRDIEFDGIISKLLLTSNQIEEIQLPWSCETNTYKEISEALKINTSLKKLALDFSTCEDDQVLKEFLNSIKHHESLETLSLFSSTINFDLLTDFLSGELTKLKSIEFGGNSESFKTIFRNESFKKWNIQNIKMYMLFSAEDFKLCLKRLSPNITIIENYLPEFEIKEFMEIIEGNYSITKFRCHKKKMSTREKEKLNFILSRNQLQQDLKNHFPKRNNVQFFDLKFKHQ